MRYTKTESKTSPLIIVELNDGESINVSSLQKGAYIVTVQDNYNNKLSRKIIKQ